MFGIGEPIRNSNMAWIKVVRFDSRWSTLVPDAKRRTRAKKNPNIFCVESGHFLILTVD